MTLQELNKIFPTEKVTFHKCDLFDWKALILVNSPFMNLNGPNTVSRSIGFTNNKNWKKVNFKKVIGVAILNNKY